MCRLFGLSSGLTRVRATFWLLDARDSLTVQSRQQPDGTGLGTFTSEGAPLVEKQPLAAFQDDSFVREAKERESGTFIAHIRHASTGGLTMTNTHPFTQQGRIFAHNGVIEDLPQLERELGHYRSMVRGDTDSERFFALITKHIGLHRGDITAGITGAATWVADRLPVYALNLILSTPTEMWALRYPDTHDLLILNRTPGAGRGHHLRHAGIAGRVRVQSGELADKPAVIFASERMDDDPGWRALASGELVHVGPRLHITSTVILDRPPVHRLTLDDLDPAAAKSQAAR